MLIKESVELCLIRSFIVILIKVEFEHCLGKHNKKNLIFLSKKKIVNLQKQKKNSQLFICKLFKFMIKIFEYK